MESPSLTAQDKKWRAESDMRTLTEAKEIESDKPRFDAAMKHGKKQVTTLQSALKRSTK